MSKQERVRAHSESTKRCESTKRWKKAHPALTRKQRARSNARYYDTLAARTAKRRCVAYDVLEDSMILEKKTSDRSIASVLHRSVKAIEVRRVRLMKQESKA